MAIEFQCEHCNTTLRVPEEHAGKKAKCPKCQAVNLIQAGTKLAPPAIDSSGSSKSPDSFPDLQTDAGAYFKPGSAAGAVSNPANPYSPSNASPLGGTYRQAHRGSMILTLGIFALVCNMMLVPGILAWIMGRADLKEIDAGRMDPEGRGMTQAGMVLGIIGTLLPLVFLAIYIVIAIVFMLFVGAAAAAA